MQIEQRAWTDDGWFVTRAMDSLVDPDLVLVFGATSFFDQSVALEALQASYPGAPLVGCSTAGEIRETVVTVDSAVATAVSFRDVDVKIETEVLPDAASSHTVGARLGARFTDAPPDHVLLLSPGVDVNGSDLVRGFTAALPPGILVTGGLAGDGDRFLSTRLLAHGEVTERTVVAVALSGSGLKVGFGSMAGWDDFGPDRLITRSDGNVLYELDGEPALDLYRRYLGPHAERLPASGLLFPLSVEVTETGQRVIRTILGIDAEAGSVILAGDVTTGSHARLMKANVDRLVDGAADAAHRCSSVDGLDAAEFALLVSCVGRRLILKQRTEEEVEAVQEALGPQAVLAGFYSYGEISPVTPEARCELHNQTMTITTFSESS